MTYTMVNNESLRTTLGLPNEWRSERDRQLFRQLCHLIFGKAKLGSLPVNRFSTGGFPFFDTDYKKKVALVERMLDPARVGKIMRLAENRNVGRLMKDHDLVIAYFVNKRRQEDRKDKKRYAMDFEYAVSSGKRGSRVLINKDVVIRGQLVPDFSAQRLRPVKGSPIQLTALLQPFAAGHRRHMGDEYWFTWKHTTVDQRAEKMNKFGHAFGTDYSDYDSTYPYFMREEMLSVMSEYYHPGVLELCRLSFSAPYFQPPVIEGGEGKWVGNPEDIRDYIFKSGIVSGNPFVDVEGKLGGVFDAISKLDKMLGDMDVRMENWLRGEDKLSADMNMGDDNLALFSTSTLRDEFKEYTLAKDAKGNYKYSYFAADVEKGQVFTGNLTTWWNEKGERTDMMRVIPRIGSMMRWFVPERGIGSKFRRYWPIGFYERQALYGANPSFGHAWEIVSRHWEKATGTNLDALAGKALDALRMPDVPYESAMDLEVLLDPEKLRYKYDEDQISDKVKDLFEHPVDRDLVNGYFEKHYSGAIYG